MIKTILSYLLTPVYLLWFGLLLVIFHPIQVITRLIWGYPVRKKVVDVLNLGPIYGLRVLGTKITFDGLEKAFRTACYYCCQPPKYLGYSSCNCRIPQESSEIYFRHSEYFVQPSSWRFGTDRP